ncbi:CPBP family intramembrane glutamate endopeptidase [Arthrobacter sp. UYP6]|uniref:CPBP family intramembrane glutamate endopeptidase n=1 Tax=Arthrobacter sp. UYP6 TaxID=1756378 RepID=UPI003394866C
MAWLILCAGIGLSVTLGRLFNEWFSLGQAGLAAIQALLVSALVVPAVLLLRRRIDHKSLNGLGLARRSTRPAAIGVAVALATACLVWLPALGAGWLAIENVDLPQLMMFFLVNALLLTFYEALPEEMALRGYAWTTIRESWTPFLSTLVVTALFPLSSAVISIMQTGSALLLGVETSGLALVPPGNDAIAYFLQLIFFGLALAAARRIPVPGALAICIAFHVVQLSINRILLGGFEWFDSGVSAVFVEPDAIALVLVHIMISGIAFLAIRKKMERRSANQA